MIDYITFFSFKWHSKNKINIILMEGYTKEIVDFFSDKQVVVRKLPTQEDVDELIDYIIFNKDFIPPIKINNIYEEFGNKSLLQIIIQKSSISSFNSILNNYNIDGGFFIKTINLEKEILYYKNKNRLLNRKINQHKINLYIERENIILSLGFFQLLEILFYFLLNYFILENRLNSMFNKNFIIMKLIISPIILLTQESISDIYLWYTIFYSIFFTFTFFNYWSNTMPSYNLDFLFSFF